MVNFEHKLQFLIKGEVALCDLFGTKPTMPTLSKLPFPLSEAIFTKWNLLKLATTDYVF
jgi:hypothetical protein